jgi:hypothetical protein
VDRFYVVFAFVSLDANERSIILDDLHASYRIVEDIMEIVLAVILAGRVDHGLVIAAATCAFANVFVFERD